MNRGTMERIEEQCTERETMQLRVHKYLGHYLAHQRRKKVAEARTKEELGIESEDHNAN